MWPVINLSALIGWNILSSLNAVTSTRWLLSVRFKYKPGDHVTCYKSSALIGWNSSIQTGE